MKQILKKITKFIVVSMYLAFFVSCCPEIEIESSIMGTATISKDPVQNGEVVYLSIGPLSFDLNGDIISVASSQYTEVNGKKRGIPMVHYYIDGTEVGHSNDWEHQFTFRYKVSELDEGPHTISAEARPQEKGTKFNGEYKESKFEVSANITNTISGIATISKNPVHNYDVVQLSIGPAPGPGITITTYFTFNGKQFGVPMVHYYIDGVEVGQSDDWEHEFAVDYTVSELEEGVHTLSAEARPQEKGTKFEGEYAESEFTVIAPK